MSDDDNFYTERRKPTLTPEDVNAICDILEARLVSRFYSNLGKGIWKLAWRGFVIAVLAIAAYGGYHSIVK